MVAVPVQKTNYPNLEELKNFVSKGNEKKMIKKTYTCAIHPVTVELQSDGEISFKMNPGTLCDFVVLSKEDTADLTEVLAQKGSLPVEPKPFKRDAKFEDIRKGDLVRVEYARDDLSVTRTGTAFERVMGGWYTSTREALLAGHPRATITILSRPEPLPTTPGAVIGFERDGMLCVGVATLGGDKIWRGAWPDGDDMYCTGDELTEERGNSWDRFVVIA